MANLVKETAIELYGEEHILVPQHSLMVTEDFSFYLHKVPGCYFSVGNGSGKDDVYCHHPQFIFHDEVIPVAARVMASVAVNYLNRG